MFYTVGLFYGRLYLSWVTSIQKNKTLMICSSHCLHLDSDAFEAGVFCLCKDQKIFVQRGMWAGGEP